MIGIGVDAVDVGRFRSSLERTPSMRSRLFTAEELELAESRGNDAATLAARFAVRRFHGSRNATNEVAALAQLRAEIAAAGLKSDSAPVFGYFDPPWTPGFFRRNEVMLRTDAAK